MLLSISVLAGSNEYEFKSFGTIVSIRYRMVWRHGAIARGPLVT